MVKIFLIWKQIVFGITIFLLEARLCYCTNPFAFSWILLHYILFLLSTMKASFPEFCFNVDEETDTQFSDPMLAELSKIEIPYDHELSQATYSMPPTSNDLTHPNPSQEIRPGTSSQDHIQNPASRQTSVSRQSSLPHWRALRSQSTSSSAIFTTGALIFPDTPSSTLYHDLDRAQAERRLSIDYGFPDQLSAIKEQEVELGFGEESVQDWGPATSASEFLPHV